MEAWVERPSWHFLEARTNVRQLCGRILRQPGQIEVLPRSLVQECMDDQIVRAQILFAESGEPPHRFFLAALLQTALIPAGSGKKSCFRGLYRHPRKGLGARLLSHLTRYHGT